MKAKIICMASAKGGSGKTVITATFGQFLTSLGKKVLLVDTDASTNGLTLLYLKEVMTQSELLIGKRIRPIGVYQSGQNISNPGVIHLASGVDLIPATYEFQNTEAIDLDSYKLVLKTIKRNYTEHYDFIFLDAQAGSDLYAYSAMERTMSDEVVIVSEYDPLSAAGIERLKGLFREDLTYDRTWILLNKVLPEFVKSFSDFMSVARYLTPIPWGADVVMSYARRRLALNMENVNSYTIAIMQALHTLLGDELEIALKEWSQEKAEQLLKPLNIIQKELKLELKLIEEKQKEVETARYESWRSRKLLSYGLVLSSFSLILFLYMKTFYEIGDNLLTYITLFAAVFPLFYFLYNHFNKNSFNNEDYITYRQRKIDLKRKLNELESLQIDNLDALFEANKSLSKDKPNFLQSL